jgi:hypothetical protein
LPKPFKPLNNSGCCCCSSSTSSGGTCSSGSQESCWESANQPSHSHHRAEQPERRRETMHHSYCLVLPHKPKGASAHQDYITRTASYCQGEQHMVHLHSHTHPS